jgi:hypothetical protein
MDVLIAGRGGRVLGKVVILSSLEPWIDHWRLLAFNGGLHFMMIAFALGWILFRWELLLATPQRRLTIVSKELNGL